MGCGSVVFILVLATAAAAAFFLGASASQDRAFSILGYDPDEIESSEAVSALYDRWRSHFAHGFSSARNSDDEEERQKRIGIFQDNLRYIDAHNRGGKHSYWLGLNQFSDLSNEEFQQRVLGTRPRNDSLSGSSPSLEQQPEPEQDDKITLPSSVDWRKEGAVTSPKDQGSCGGCWAFSTTGAIEGINKIVTGDLISLSEQELVDCDTVNDNGCDGGLMENAFQFIIKNGGLDTEADYPYRAHQGKCDEKKKNDRVVSIDSYKSIAPGDENSILRAAAKQPVSVAIEGGGRPFQHYAGGVFTGPCGEDINHGVLVVGYGSEDGLDYWIVKNSWGPTWGEAGFVKMQRNLVEAENKKGLCSINTLASYPIKSAPTPTPEPPSPPSPPTPTQRCDTLQSCPADTTCCCRFPVGPMCLTWSCCKLESAVCCPDHRHCCPHDHPVCKPSTGQCLKNPSSVVGVKISESIPAQSFFKRRKHRRPV